MSKVNRSATYREILPPKEYIPNGKEVEKVLWDAIGENKPDKDLSRLERTDWRDAVALVDEEEEEEKESQIGKLNWNKVEMLVTTEGSGLF
ncbi:MAG: hypothetical protein M1823_006274 [Watsoniomyces obsoletus]|nr:MAG: hypothetical protein M1823_006274 [Watsoniomyces obsoletus]